MNTADHPSVDFLFRLAPAKDWERAREAGEYAGGDLDRRDGFLHLSTAAQVVETAAVHYAGVSDLVLLTIPAAPLAAALRWEVSRSGALFPHLYRPLKAGEVESATPLPLDKDGKHTFPSLPG